MELASCSGEAFQTAGRDLTEAGATPARGQSPVGPSLYPPSAESDHLLQLSIPENQFAVPQGREGGGPLSLSPESRPASPCSGLTSWDARKPDSTCLSYLYSHLLAGGDFLNIQALLNSDPAQAYTRKPIFWSERHLLCARYNHYLL